MRPSPKHNVIRTMAIEATTPIKLSIVFCTTGLTFMNNIMQGDWMFTTNHQLYALVKKYFLFLCSNPSVLSNKIVQHVIKYPQV